MESVIMKKILREFGEKSETNRQKMVAAAKRAIKKGDDSVYHNAVSSLLKGGANKETLGKFQSDFEKDDLNDQPANNLATNEGKQYKVNETQLHQIIRESVMRILNEVYTGDEPFVPNKYPGQVPKFHSKEEYDKWWHDEAPDDWFDWVDDRKWQRTGIQPGYSAMANKADWDRKKGKMSWNNDKRYLRFNQLKQKNGIQ